ncbi:MAG: hypothetical protein NTX66_00465 [Candidatus Falkowbacteria bacterium]|nr:hypothetical protein [Candidatus Falkowbacteria bacterium]
MPKKLQVFLFFVFSLILLFWLAPVVRADSCDVDVSFVVRDPDGNFIPGATVDVYRQVIDANGYHKPGVRLGGANVNATLGSAVFHYRDPEGGGTVAARVKTTNNQSAPFYFYDLSASCGDNSFDETLSGLNLILRDADGNLQQNTKINIYTQKYDADNKPVKEKKDLVTTLNTSVIGEAKVYVPQGSVNSIDGQGANFYVLEIVRPKGTFIEYDLAVTAGNLTSLEYFLSALQANFTSPDGSFFPGKTKVEVFKQITDSNNARQKGAKVGDFSTDDSGTGTFEYPAGLYVLGIIGKDGKYQYFWDIEIQDQKLNEYNLSSSTNWTPNAGACESNSTLTLMVGDYYNQSLSGIKFELYDQLTNLNNQPVASSNAIAKGTIDSSGRALVTFKPDSRKIYALKLYDKNANFGEFWFFNAVKFVCGYDRTVTKSLPALKIILRDSAGRLKKNTSFSLYTQQIDADGNPAKEKKDLVATLNTGADGEAIVYVAPSHPYDLDKSGVYVISVSGDHNSVFELYNIKVNPVQNTVIDYSLSELVVTLKNASGQLLPNQAVRLYEQLSNSEGRVLGKQLVPGKTDNNGIWRFEYPAGRYALVISDDLKKDNIFWDVNVKAAKSNRFTLDANLLQMNLNNSQIVNLPSSLTLKVFALVNSGGDSYIKGKEQGSLYMKPGFTNRFSLSQAPYLISYIDTKNKVEYGVAIWAQNHKLQKLTLNLKATSRIAPDQLFHLSPPSVSTAINTTPGDKPAATATVSNSSLANKLKGYILLQIENQGQAWYVNPRTGKRRYLANGQAAFDLMRGLGLGISNSNLRKIPVGLDNRFYSNFEDSDGDGLPDIIESALGTNKNNSDTDGDGFLDGAEVASGFDPWQANKHWPIEAKLVNSLKGRILLQVQAAGQAWYLYPKNSKRYFLADGDTALQIMKYLGLGVTNKDLEQIPIED